MRERAPCGPQAGGDGARRSADAGACAKPCAGARKNDAADAEAIADAVRRPRMRVVPITSRAPLDLQAVHRVRDRLASRRMAVGDRIRVLLAERGIVMRQGRGGVRGVAPAPQQDPDGPPSATLHRLIAALRAAWLATERAVQDLSRRLEAPAEREETCRRPDDGTIGAG